MTRHEARAGFRATHHQWACLAVLLVATLHPAAAAPSGQTITDQRERAVAWARQGDHDRALERLQALHAAHPDRVRIAHDLLVVQVWAGHDRAATRLAERIPLDAAPAYVLRALARARRNLGDFEGAIRAYRQALARSDGAREDRIGLALSLSDAGRSDSALAILEPLAQAYPGDPETAFAAGYVRRRAGDPVHALAHFDRVLALSPGHAEAYRLKALSAADAGAATLALELARERPGVFTDADRQRLHGDRAAQGVRWGGIPEARDEPRHAQTDLALARLDRRLATLPDGSPAHRRARFDRILALRQRSRMDEIVTEYRALTEAGVDLPAYVLNAVAEAMLYLRRPDAAVGVYEAALQARPGHFDSRVGLFHALIEAERFDEALELIDAVAAGQPEWRQHPGLREPQPNPHKRQADRLAAMGRAFGDRLVLAQQRLEPLVERAPADIGLRESLATVYRWRGWPERALGEYRIAHTRDPEARGVRLGLAATLMDLGRLEEVEPMVVSLTEEAPEDAHVQRLQRDWELEHSPALRYSATFGSSTGDELGTEDYTLEGHLYSALWNHRDRIFIHSYDAFAEFPEGDATYHRIGIGAQRSSERRRLAVELSRDRVGEADTGVSVSGDWQLDDIWSVGALVESFTTAVPLRAHRQGIEGERVRLDGGYRHSDRRDVAVSLDMVSMSDGNDRISALVRGRQRLMTRPHFRLTGAAELHATRNTREDAVYFNPREAQSLNLGLTGDWLAHRHYDRSVNHRLTLTPGLYHQDGFGTEPTAVLDYELEVKLRRSLSFRVGGQVSTRVFDGDREERWAIHSVLDWRLW